MKRTEESEGIFRIIANGNFVYYNFIDERVVDDIYGVPPDFDISYNFGGEEIEPEYFF